MEQKLEVDASLSNWVLVTDQSGEKFVGHIEHTGPLCGAEMAYLEPAYIVLSGWRIDRDSIERQRQIVPIEFMASSRGIAVAVANVVYLQKLDDPDREMWVNWIKNAERCRTGLVMQRSGLHLPQGMPTVARQ